MTVAELLELLEDARARVVVAACEIENGTADVAYLVLVDLEHDLGRDLGRLADAA